MIFVSCLVVINLNLQTSHQLSSYKCISDWFVCLLCLEERGSIMAVGRHGGWSERWLVMWGPQWGQRDECSWSSSFLLSPLYPLLGSFMLLPTSTWVVPSKTLKGLPWQCLQHSILQSSSQLKLGITCSCFVYLKLLWFFKTFLFVPSTCDFHGSKNYKGR